MSNFRKNEIPPRIPSVRKTSFVGATTARNFFDVAFDLGKSRASVTIFNPQLELSMMKAKKKRKKRKCVNCGGEVEGLQLFCKRDLNRIKRTGWPNLLKITHPDGTKTKEFDEDALLYTREHRREILKAMGGKVPEKLRKEIGWEKTKFILGLGGLSDAI